MEHDTDPSSRLNKQENFENKTLTSLFSSETCRICLSQNSDKLINLCECNNETKHVHESCLIQWLYEKYSTLEMVSCEYCKSPFRIKVVKKYSCDKNYSDLGEYQIYRKGLKIAFVLFFVMTLWPIATFYFTLHDKRVNFSVLFPLSLIPAICAFVFLMFCLFKLFVSISVHYQLPDKEIENNESYPN